jgi:hypothetical protein
MEKFGGVMTIASAWDLIAKTVVIRHVCHCDSAVVEPDDDAAEEHVFTVDGEDFPWFITERGQIVKRLRDDLYSIDVEIVQLDRATLATLPFDYTRTEEGCSVPSVPVIGGREFPWALTDDVMTLTFGYKVYPTLHLAFYAREVDANIPIEDLRDNPQDVFCEGGDLIA